jgi:sugar lactone lactonase YvrE
MQAFQQIGETRDRVGESPVWHVDLQALYWVDIESRLVRRHVVGSARTESWELPERIGCISLVEDGRVVAAMESGIALLTLESQGRVQLEWLAHASHPAPGMRFNDGRCDRTGRLWVGTMVMDMALGLPLGGLYCLDERGLTGPYVQGMLTPNGLGFSPDGRTMYLSDSHPKAQKIWAFDYDPETGTPSRQRLLVDMVGLPGRPDGAAVDDEGHYWICGNDAGLVHRFSPDGRLERSVAVPMAKPSMCAFGGPDLGTLFVTSIVPASGDPGGLSGALLAMPVGLQGLPEPYFSRFPAAA